MLNVLMSFNWANIKILGDSAGGAECPSSQAEQANCCIEKAVCKAGRVFSVTEFACPICEKHSASPVCKVSHDTFLLQRHKKVSGAEPERQDVMMSPDFGGCSFERLPVVYREPHALSRTRVLPLDHRVRTDRADHQSWAVRERGTTLLSRDVLRVTWPAQLAREHQWVHHFILCRRL